MVFVICLPTEHLKGAQGLIQYVPVHSGSNWNLAVLVFEKREKLEYPEKNSGARREPTTNSRIKPGTHWWEVSALTAVPLLLPMAKS